MVMSLNRLFAIAYKEFNHVTRDVRTLLLVTIVPAFLLVLLAYVFSFDVEHFNLIIWDQDKSEVSRRYIADLTSDGTFNVLAYVRSYAEIDDWLQTGRAKVALIIPIGVAADLQARRPANVQAVIDGVDSIASGQAVTQLDTRTQLFSLKLLPTFTGSTAGQIETRGLAWYNASLKSVQSMVPGLVAVVLTMPALAFAISLTREKELGSFEGLVSTPIRGTEYLLGKLLTYLGFGLISLVPVLLVATFWFHVPFQGSPGVLIAVTICYYVATFGISMLIANFVKSQQAAMLFMILLFFVPSLFLSGLILPIDTSSLPTHLASEALPSTHFIVISRGVFLKGLGLINMTQPLAALLIVGTATVVLSLTLFRKRIA
jgi:ABC-2 type transport system permease protein